MNKADKRRFLAITEIGCLACRQEFADDKNAKNDDFSYTTDVHHLLKAGSRIGHYATIGLCPWHHRGIIVNGMLPLEFMNDYYGPSLAHGRERFEEHFLTQDELLEWQNELIEEWGNE